MKWGKKWVVFVTAPDQITGEMWCTMLRASGINCRLRDENPSFIGPSLFPVRLMAPEDQSRLALQLLENEIDLGPKNASRAMRELENQEDAMQPDPERGVRTENGQYEPL